MPFRVVDAGTSPVPPETQRSLYADPASFVMSINGVLYRVVYRLGKAVEESGSVVIPENFGRGALYFTAVPDAADLQGESQESLDSESDQSPA